MADSKPRAENNLKVSAFIMLPPRWRVSFVATKLLLLLVAAIQPARQRCFFRRARRRYYSSLGETTLPTKCRTIFRVECRRAKTLRFSTTLRSAKCPGGKSWNKSSWRIQKQANAELYGRQPSFRWSAPGHAPSGCRRKLSGTKKDS